MASRFYSKFEFCVDMFSYVISSFVVVSKILRQSFISYVFLQVFKGHLQDRKQRQALVHLNTEILRLVSHCLHVMPDVHTCCHDVCMTDSGLTLQAKCYNICQLYAWLLLWQVVSTNLHPLLSCYTLLHFHQDRISRDKAAPFKCRFNLQHTSLPQFSILVKTTFSKMVVNFLCGTFQISRQLNPVEVRFFCLGRARP